MKKLILVVALALISACSKESASLEIQPGSTVTLERKDGVVVAGSASALRTRLART